MDNLTDVLSEDSALNLEEEVKIVEDSKKAVNATPDQVACEPMSPQEETKTVFLKRHKKVIIGAGLLVFGAIIVGGFFWETSSSSHLVRNDHPVVSIPDEVMTHASQQPITAEQYEAMIAENRPYEESTKSETKPVSSTVSSEQTEKTIDEQSSKHTNRHPSHKNLQSLEGESMALDRSQYLTLEAVFNEGGREVKTILVPLGTKVRARLLTPADNFLQTESIVAELLESPHSTLEGVKLMGSAYARSGMTRLFVVFSKAVLSNGDEIDILASACDDSHVGLVANVDKRVNTTLLKRTATGLAAFGSSLFTGDVGTVGGDALREVQESFVNDMDTSRRLSVPAMTSFTLFFNKGVAL